MRKFIYAIVLLSMALILCSPIPGDARGGGFHGGYRGGWGWGWWPWVIGGAIIGESLAWSPYYYPPPPPVVVQTTPPITSGNTTAAPQPSVVASGGKLFIYPRNGQSEQQQVDDRYQCHQWAVNQAGYDPTQTSGSGTSPNYADYQRAMGACLDARGYSVK